MDALSWLLVHGDAVWRASLGITGVAITGALGLRPRLRARRAAELARADLGWPTEPAHRRVGHRTTFRGELDLTGPTPELAVEDLRVRLDGPMTVTAGSRETWSRGDLVSRSLASGDRVRVAGILHAEASDDPSSYRHAAKRFSLTGPVTAAFEGRPQVSASIASILARGLLATTLFALVVFGVGGRVCLSIALGELATFDDRAPLAMSLAAASPFTRTAALTAYADALAARQDPEPRTLAVRATLNELVGRQADNAEMWIAHGEPSRGAELALATRADRLAARGFYAAGDFTRAADAWSLRADDDEREIRFGLGVSLLAHRWERAAKLARVLAVIFRGESLRKTSSPAPETWFHQRTEAAICLAEALEARAGTTMARHRLGAPRACALLALDGLKGDARLRAARELSWSSIELEAHDVPLVWFDLLLAEAGDEPKDRPFAWSAAEELTVPNGGLLARSLPAVERALAERPGGAPSARLAWSGSAAVFARLAGDREAGERLAHAAPPGTLAAIALPDDARPADADLRPAVNGKETPGIAFLHGLRDVVVERDAGVLLRQLAQSPPPNEGERHAWALAASGDGVGLARWLRAPSSAPGTFLRYGARSLLLGRTAVRDWVRWGYRPVRAFHPTETLVHTATLADAARDLGDGEAATLLGERARRFREAILDRAIAVPLAVLDRL